MTPVAGFAVTTFTHKGVAFMTWYMSNERHLRRLWRHYFQFCDAIVFVMDASDRDRAEEAADKLHEIFQFEELADSKLLVLANKQDRPGCMTLEEIEQKLNVRGVTQNAVHVQKTVATTGAGINEGLTWLAKGRRSHYTMGNVVSQWIYLALDKLASRPTRPCRVLLLGLDNAGKMTLLYKLKLNEVVTTVPTIGFNVENFTHKHIEFTAWDIGGQGRSRPLWKHYFENTQAVIFIVDASDSGRMKQAAQRLEEVFHYEELANAKLLVLANKQDCANCMALEEIDQILNVRGVTQNAYHIEATVATRGVGVYEGLNWLADQI